MYRSQAVHDLLYFLTRYHTDEFSITELTDAVEYSQPSISKAVDILVANDLVIEKREGNTRNVRINSGRLSRPDDPVLEVPQAEFQPPVRAAVEVLCEDLDGVLGVVLFGSVARGEADRRSDIDLWVLVEEDRMTNQRTANRIRQDLEEREFDTGRYAYEIDVETLPAVPNYVDELREILGDGIVLYDSEKFETVQQMVFHGDLDE
ncbi:nucleotidyltransferase [Halosimplex carlsbadense 2-9-1]|uniref:Nucleotidyltransferase n=1 Tax=Halosimplex carlsbadense 2-9-1 TaxID=797114 RepID=M0CAT3_9EURY|nr:nucleotidyltransferase [Halosimplex carlsbadense 2-9-1]